MKLLSRWLVTRNEANQIELAAYAKGYSDAKQEDLHIVEAIMRQRHPLVERIKSVLGNEFVN